MKWTDVVEKGYEVDRCGREGLMKWTDVEEKGYEVDRCGREGL